MKSKPSNNKKNRLADRQAKPTLIVLAFLGINLVNLAFVLVVMSLLMPGDNSVAIDQNTQSKTLGANKTLRANKQAPRAIPNPKTPPSAPLPAIPQFDHLGITTTVFWVGEDASADNNNIQNHSSAWVEDWLGAYGGIDSPNNRSGFLPSSFTPKENPFYIALPYNDLDENGARKATATKCPGTHASKYSWCKNSWVAIRCSGKIAYGQWEDAGPNGEDDVNYVFGSAKPLNQFDSKAGLDISPAIRDYLGLKDVSVCDWVFVSTNFVPPGPWLTKVTNTPSYEVSN